MPGVWILKPVKLPRKSLINRLTYAKPSFQQLTAQCSNHRPSMNWVQVDPEFHHSVTRKVS